MSDVADRLTNVAEVANASVLKPKIPVRDKAEHTTFVARAIMDAEAAEREKKTERLRALRLEHEARLAAEAAAAAALKAPAPKAPAPAAPAPKIAGVKAAPPKVAKPKAAKPVMANVVRVDRELEDPLPDDAHDLDLVVMAFFYHDSVWQGTDRAAMNRAIFAALRPGGSFVVLDHAARSGDGVTVAQTLHRIEESVVKDELRAAGFELGREASFLRNVEDARDWSASPGAAGERRGTSDRFVLEARRPAR